MTNMRTIRIEKVTLNIGAGNDQEVLKKGIKLIETITGRKAIKTITQQRIPSWGLRPGLPVGGKITLRKEIAKEVLGRVLQGRDTKLSKSNFDEHGNVNFGLTEYLYIPKMKYDPDIGILGFEVSVTLERPGFRIKRRKLLKRKLTKKQGISPEEAIDFMKKEFNVEVQE